MGLAVLILLLAVAAAVSCGGRPAGLTGLRVHGAGWLVAGLAVQVLGSLLAGTGAYPIALVVSVGLVLPFVARNRRVAGIPLAGLGLGLNAVVVALNGAMPVSPRAQARAGVPVRPAADTRYELVGPDTHLAFLGEVVPVALPPHREVDSPGDVLVAAGLGLLVFTGMLAPRRSPEEREEPVLAGLPD